MMATLSGEESQEQKKWELFFTNLGKGHFPLSFSSSTYLTRTSLNLWRSEVTASLVVTCVESDCAKELVESCAVNPLLVSKDFLDEPLSAKGASHINNMHETHE
ncbi:hypothetical protein E2C01_026011 [Portunus trituberculatus]|uniref:Uncharacterized protein n=1 Tax=Portunus trituberculatus TaxID=210409 RepID=A0A5B7EHP7_PORTR|nr:hypothetical protein [Portunus trituberculatus]